MKNKYIEAAVQRIKCTVLQLVFLTLNHVYKQLKIKFYEKNFTNFIVCLNGNCVTNRSLGTGRTGY